MKQITVTLADLDNNNGGGGLEIIIPGTIANTQDSLHCPVFIEYYEGKLRLLVWNNTQDPDITELILTRDYQKAYQTPYSKLPLLINSIQDEDAKELLNKRLAAGK